MKAPAIRRTAAIWIDVGLMEGEPLGDNGVITALTTFDQLRLQRNALFSRFVRGVTRAAQQPLHFARPRLFLDLDESLQFAQMMSIAQGVQHALKAVDATCSHPCASTR